MISVEAGVWQDGNWVRASKCPLCGGKMRFRTSFSVIRDYEIGDDGSRSETPCEAYRSETDYIVWCTKCLSRWIADYVGVFDKVVLIRNEEDEDG